MTTPLKESYMKVLCHFIEVVKPCDEQKPPALGEKEKPDEKEKYVRKDKMVEKDDENGMNKKVIEKSLPLHKRKKKGNNKYEKWLDKWEWFPKKEPP